MVYGVCVYVLVVDISRHVVFCLTPWKAEPVWCMTAAAAAVERLACQGGSSPVVVDGVALLYNDNIESSWCMASQRYIINYI